MRNDATKFVQHVAVQHRVEQSQNESAKGPLLPGNAPSYVKFPDYEDITLAAWAFDSLRYKLAPPNCPLRYPQYHLMETIRPSKEVGTLWVYRDGAP